MIYAYTGPRYQVSVYRNIGPLLIINNLIFCIQMSKLIIIYIFHHIIRNLNLSDI